MFKKGEKVRFMRDDGKLSYVHTIHSDQSDDDWVWVADLPAAKAFCVKADRVRRV